MKRAELRKRVRDAILDHVSPEDFAVGVVAGLHAYHEHKTIDARTGELVKIQTPNWSTIHDSLNLIKEIWGVEASKQVEDVTDKDENDFTIEQLEEQKRIKDARIEELVSGNDADIRPDREEDFTRQGEERLEVSI